jgi:lipopolysaccharide export system permease protein
MQRIYLWRRYFYKEIAKTYLFLLFCFYFLYVALDLMTHIKDFRSSGISLFTWGIYYLCIFSKRLDIFLPFTILVGSIRLLLNFQSRNEFVALLTSGVSFKALLQPFLFAAAIGSLALYANFEFILPTALTQATYIQESNFGKSAAFEQETPFREVMLKDGSRVIYRAYNPGKKEFQDVFWIASLDVIYHMKTLSCDSKSQMARFVDMITRDSQGLLQKTASWKEIELKKMQFDEESVKNSITPIPEQSLSQLFSQMLLYRKSSSDRANELRNNFYFKCTFPLICILAFVAVCPYCMRFSRSGLPVLMIYLVSISGLFCFFLLLQVAFVLGKSQIVATWIATLVPWTLAFLLCWKKYGTL